VLDTDVGAVMFADARVTAKTLAVVKHVAARASSVRGQVHSVLVAILGTVALSPFQENFFDFFPIDQRDFARVMFVRRE